MLGARARAAEYHAAKAATARQQASKDADEQVPKPAPVSLGIYARNPFTNRNKGTKNFIPLILSEEEGQERRSASSIDYGIDVQPSPSPQSEHADPPRPASLPLPQTLGSSNLVQEELERAVQTPHRYKEPYRHHLVPLAPRAMLSDDGFAYHQGPSFCTGQQPGPAYNHNHPYIPQHIMSMQNLGWYTPPEQYLVQHSYLDAGMLSMTPVPEPCPPFTHVRSHESVNRSKTPNDSSEATNLQLSLETTPKLGGPQLYFFGPDDISPSKIEMKQKAREDCFREDSSAVSAPAITIQQSQAGNRGLTNDHGQLNLFQAMHNSGRDRDRDFQHAASLDGLLAEHNMIVSVKARGGARETEISGHSDFEAVVRQESPLQQGRTEADWPYLGQARTGGLEAMEHFTSPARENEVTRGQIDENAIRALVESMQAKQEETAVIPCPPPGLEHTQLATVQVRESEGTQLTGYKFPLVDPNSAEWLEVRMPNEAERERMRRVYRSIRDASSSDRHHVPGGDMRDARRAQIEEWIGTRVDDYESRRQKITKLVDEVQDKWEQGDTSHPVSVSRSQAQHHAGTVMALGEMTMALNMQLDDNSGRSFRGSRPYGQAPDYAIERSVGLGRHAGSTSLFESDSEVTIPAPPRLARDPRFRAQLVEGLNLGVDENRIPRMFAPRRYR